MSHIFISYSRKDLAIAEKIINALAKDGLEPWIDWKSIPKGETFEGEIYQGIEKAEVFLFLVSSDSVQSDWCNKEIAHAAKNGKRILPIVIRDTDPKTFHPEISKRNWIFCRDGQDDFNKAIEETRKTIHMDYEWLKYHTELQVKALKWEQKKDTSRLLRGKELREADQQLAEISNQEDPQPTKLQREYILISQRNEVRTRRQIMIGLVAGLAIMIVLSFVAWGQRNESISQRATADAERTRAEVEANVAHARELATTAQLGFENSETAVDLNALLAVESLKRYPTIEGYQSVRLALERLPQEIATIDVQSNHAIDLEPNVIFSPNGKWLVTGQLGKFHIWDTNTWSQHVVIEDNESSRFVSFSTDNNYFFTAYNTDNGQSLITAWNTKNWVPENTFRHKDTFRKIAICPNKLLVAAENGDNLFQVWELASGGNLFSVGSDVPDTRFIFAFDSECKWLALYRSDENQINIWDTNSKSIIASLKSSGALLKFSSDGKMLASIMPSGVILWDTSEWRQQSVEFPTGDWAITDLAFSPDNSKLLTGHWNYFVKLWDINTGEELLRIRHNSRALSVAFSPDGRYIAANSGADGATIWNAKPGWEISHLPVNEYISSLSLSSDNNIVAFGYSFGVINSVPYFCTWDVSKNKTDCSEQSYQVTAIAFSPDGQEIAFGNEAGIIYLQNNGSRFEPKPLPIDEQKISSLAFAPDGTALIIGDESGKITIWGTMSREVIFQKKLENPIKNVFFHPEQNRAIFVDSFSISVWDYVEDEQVLNIPIKCDTGFGCEYGTYNTVKSLIAVTDGISKGVWIYDLSEGDLVAQFSHDIGASNIAFSPDGKYIAVGGTSCPMCRENRSIQIWEIERGIKIANIIAPEIDQLLFSSDGRWLILSDYSINIWLWRPEDLIAEACKRPSRNLTLAEWQQYIDNEPYCITCTQWPAGE